jgi:hypothetical protein
MNIGIIHAHNSVLISQCSSIPSIDREASQGTKRFAGPTVPAEASAGMNGL